jgi:thienamycin biosynthesis protein ThnO
MVAGECLPRVFDPSQGGREVPPVTSLSCLLCGHEYATSASYELRNGRGELVARAGRTPRLLQFRMVSEAGKIGSSLRAIGNPEWLGFFGEAGRAFSLGALEFAELTSATSGLPIARVLKAYDTLSTDLLRMGEILAAQTPSGDCNATLCVPPMSRQSMLIPSGRHVAVRIPGNFPTININWLICLAARRPVLLCASLQDPFTVHRLARCLLDAGIPQNAIALCYGESDSFWQHGDQALLSGEPPISLPRDPTRTKIYHHGRSKALLSGLPLDQNQAMRIAVLATQGCGRLCTNISGLLTERDGEATATALASAMALFPVLPLRDPKAMVPCFPDRAAANSIVNAISSAIARGGKDISGNLTGKPLLMELADGAFLRPTVLLMDPDDPIFGAEFPFPFVTVARCPVSEFTRRCRGSLVVSLIGGNQALLEDLIFEPTIDKVFHGEDFDRGYDPIDPHEGYLIDFLFRRKAVSPYGI